MRLSASYQKTHQSTRIIDELKNDDKHKQKHAELKFMNIQYLLLTLIRKKICSTTVSIFNY